MALLTARRAAEVADFFGVNLHLGQGLYPSQARYIELIKELGIKNYRIGYTPWTELDIKAIYAQTGAKACLITASYDVSKPSTIIDTLKNLIGVAPIRYIENPNEPDGFGLNYEGLSYPASIAKFATDLKTALRGSTSTTEIKALPIVGTSVAYYHSDGIDLSVLVDMGNTHPYDSEKLPEATEHYGSIREIVQGTDKIHGSNKPRIATEYGYYQSVAATPNQTWDYGQRYPISETANAKYVIRRSLFLLDNSYGNFKHGYIYELRDGGGNLEQKEESFGLTKYDGTPKASFYAIKHLIATVKDDAANAFTFTPTPLDIAFSGDTTNLQSRLYQKANGNYVLALWRKLKSYQEEIRDANGVVTTPRGDINYTSTNVTVSLSGLTNIAVNRVDLVSGTKTVIGNSSSFSVPVADSVVLVEINKVAVPSVLASFYSLTNYGGDKLELTSPGVYNLEGSLLYMNNTIESLKVSPGVRATVYAKYNQGETPLVYTEGSYPTIPSSMNNFASCIKIELV